MRPENLKFLLQSFIESEQDECDGPGNIAEASHYVEQSGTFPTSPFSHFAPALAPAAVPNNVNAVGRNLAELAEQFANAQPEKSIIKFKEICMIKEPVEQIIAIPVIRDQNFSQNITKVSFKTCDKTALSGTHYTESSGEILFNQGETIKDIYIEILNSTDEADDLHFTVELKYDGVFAPRPLTISLRKISNLEPSERTVLNSLPRSLPFTVHDIKYALDSCLNARTFHMALTHLCSTSDAVDVQLALALKLSSLCIRKSYGKIMRQDSIVKVLDAFFKMDDDYKG